MRYGFVCSGCRYASNAARPACQNLVGDHYAKRCVSVSKCYHKSTAEKPVPVERLKPGPKTQRVFRKIAP